MSPNTNADKTACTPFSSSLPSLPVSKYRAVKPRAIPPQSARASPKRPGPNRIFNGTLCFLSAPPGTVWYVTISVKVSCGISGLIIKAPCISAGIVFGRRSIGRLAFEPGSTLCGFFSLMLEEIRLQHFGHPSLTATLVTEIPRESGTFPRRICTGLLPEILTYAGSFCSSTCRRSVFVAL